MIRPRTLLWLLAAGLLVGLLLWRSGFGAPALRSYAPERYVERADAFIRAGYLRADCSSGGEPRLVADLEQAPPHERSWYHDSYLAADVARHNADPDGFGWTFVIDADCRLRGVNPVVHAIELPFGRRLRWLGEILYRGEGSDAVLRSARRTLTLRRSPAPISTQEQAWTPVGADQEVLKEGVVMLHYAGGRSQPAARLYHVGESVVVANRVRAGQPEAVRLMGYQLPVGSKVRLETGDWLNLAAAAPSPVEETFVFVGGEALETASAVRLQNERYERRTEDPGLGLSYDPIRESASPYLAQVAEGIDRSLAALPPDQADGLSESFDVQLSLERDVQLRLSHVFQQHCRDLAQRLHLGRPLRAGMTVMDGLSGEVLALATFPDEDALEREPLEDGTTRRRLLANQNLVRHPIGSAIKPFLFAAVAAAHPQLVDLVIEGHEPAERHADLFHCEMPTGYQLLEGHRVPIDFRTALEVSCNKYTVELVTLALAADVGEGGRIGRDAGVEWPPPGTSSGVRVGGRTIDYGPDLGEYVLRQDRSPRDPESTAAVRCVTVDRLENARFRTPLEIVTGAATYYGRVPQALPEDATQRQLEVGYATSRYDLEPWRAVLAHLTAGADEDTAWKVRATLQSIAPERVNLAFNQITRLRGDYISLLLGGGTSLWTNLQLAEAMSRLVTGREVEVRLVSRIRPREDEDAAEGSAAESVPPRTLGAPLALAPAARTAVLEGLARVVAGGGTAKALRDELEKVRAAFPGDWVGLYSKTGSPIIERPVPRATAVILERLVARGRLRLEGDEVVVRAGDRRAPHSRRGSGGRTAYLDTLRAAIAEVGYRTHAGRFLPAMSAVIDRFVEDLRDPAVDPLEIDGPIQVEAGALRLDRSARLFRQNLVPGMGAAYIFSLVRLPNRTASGVPTPEEMAAPEARVVTVAVYLEADEDSKLAVAAAERVVPELISLLR